MADLHIAYRNPQTPVRPWRTNLIQTEDGEVYVQVYHQRFDYQSNLYWSVDHVFEVDFGSREGAA